MLGAQARPRLRYAALAAAVTVLLLFYTQADGGDHLLRSVVELAAPRNGSTGLGTSSAAASPHHRHQHHHHHPDWGGAPPPAEKSGYVVWSPSCQIADLDPYDASIRGLLKPVDPIVCSRKPPLTYTAALNEDASSEGAVSGHVLRVDEGLVSQYVPKSRRLSCCYSNITRFTLPAGVKYTKEADNYYNISSCTNFQKEVKLKPEEEFILVRCSSYHNGKAKREVYVNMHGVVPIKPSVVEKRKERRTFDDDPWLNVLMVGFDSVSRLNLLRTMPRTVAYLRRAGYVDLKGYNKIGDNTFPNIMAILTGLSMDQLHSGCWPNKTSKVDDCPFVWKEFHNQSYVSLYAEDEPTMSTFNFQKTGFVNQPTHYYFRPYMLVGSKKLKLQRRNNLDVCMGPVTTTDHLLRYAIDFVITFKNSLYFALLWLNNFSHNDVNDPGAMDLRALQFFNELSGTGTYNNTIVIFFSDHGMRFGKIRQTYVGWLEERLPFIYILVPPWFKKKYPEAHQNLLTNRNRLTSPYDLHVTLKEILDRGLNNTTPTANVSLACPKCRSLFAEDFGDRSCDDAGITPHWCTCTQYKDLPVNNTLVQNAAKYVLAEIQRKIKKSSLSKLCADLIMSQVIKASMKVHVNENNPDHDDYVIIFETLPGGALFETTVRRELSEEGKYSVMGMVSRINSYASHSYCVSDGELKLYCFCLPT